MISHWPPDPFVPYVAPPGPEQDQESGPNGRGDILPVLELGARVVEAFSLSLPGVDWEAFKMPAP